MESLDPSKFHVMSEKTKKKIITISLIAAIFVLPVISYGFYKLSVNRPAQYFNEATFEILEGESLDLVTERLQDLGLVNSGFLLKVYLYLNDNHRNIQAGVFTIPAGSSVVEIAEILQHGTNDIKLTFIEGWRVEEVARLASQKLPKVDYEKFVDKALAHEGYLFPDTYYFNVNATEDDVIATMRATFDRKTSDLFTSKEFVGLGLAREDVVNFASIVEREVHNENDRKIVAGILINRYLNGELIGADATTQYAVAVNSICFSAVATGTICPDENAAREFNWWPKELRVGDLDFDSPYNTRKVAGLPPRPISSPGYSAISAVINKVDTNYNYYLTDAEGITHYASTLEEHNRNVYQYL